MVLALLVALLYLPYLGQKDLVHEEPRRAVVAQNMMESGDYLVPRFAGRTYLNKPPLFNWLIAAASAPSGKVTELTARLPSVVALAALAIFMVWVTRSFLPPPGQWFLGLAMVLAPELMHKAVLAEIEIVFTLLVSASLWLWFELDRRGARGLWLWLPPAVLVSLAFLTKREPGLIFYYLGIGGYLLLRGRWRELFSPAQIGSAALVVAVVLGYAALLAAHTSWSAIAANIQQEVLARDLQSSAVDYLITPVTYPLELLAATLPFSILLIALVSRPVRASVVDRFGEACVFAAVVVLINLPIYLAQGNAAKVRYFLPMLPTLLVLCAMVYQHYGEAVRDWRAAARRFVAGAAGLFLVVAVALAAASAGFALPWLLPPIPGPLLPVSATLSIALLVLIAAAVIWRLRAARPAAFVLAAFVAAGLGYRWVELNYILPSDLATIRTEENSPKVLASIREALPDDVRRIQALGVMPVSFWYYDRRGLLAPPVHLEREGRPVSPYVLVSAAERELITEAGRPAEILARFPYKSRTFMLVRLESGDGATG